MIWQIALSFNILFSAIRGIIQKKILRDMDPMTFLMYVIAYMEVIVFVAYLVRNRHFPPVYPDIMLLGMLFGLATTALFSAVKISLTQTSIFGSYRLVVPILLASVFFNEWTLFTPKTIAGLAVAALALYIMATGTKKKEEKTNLRWLLIIGAYIILDGTGQFWNKAVLGSHHILEVLHSQFLGEIPFLFAINLLRKQPLHISRSQHGWIMADSIAEVGFAVCILAALAAGPITLILPVQTLGTTIAGALVGLLLFREASGFTSRKWLGIGLGLTGIILLVL